MDRLIFTAYKLPVIFCLFVILSACSNSSQDGVNQIKPKLTQEGASTVTTTSIDTAPVTTSEKSRSNNHTALGKLSNLIETVRDAKSHDKPLTEAERAEIEDVLAQLKSLQNNPEAVKKIETLKSNLAELKGLDESQISFDTRILHR